MRRGGFLRRAVAAAALVLLTLPSFASLAVAEDDGPHCCRGRCCCAGERPSDRDCLRAACPCGRESHSNAPTAPESVAAVLPAAVTAGRPQAAAGTALDSAAAPRAGVPAPVDPPPWSLLSRSAFP